MKTRLLTTILLTLMTGMVTGQPVDMANRADELKSLRWGMFICWSFSTYSGKEWTPGVKDVAYFKATEVDTDQWARTAKEAGMGYILFLTKHHDGFCLWDTKTTDRKVTKAPLGRDVLAELKQSCDKYGIKLALYFSEGEWRQPGGLDDPATPEPKKRNQGGSNVELKKAQLKELLTQYGPIEYIWFDHAVGTGGLSHEETIAWCKSFQPGCFVGFNHGDQEGADIRLGEMGKPGPLADNSGAGYNKGVPSKSYLLAEFTYPILPEHQGGAMWFYSLPKHDNLCLPAEKLYQDYLGAAKFGNIFSIDVGPDYNGKLRDIDVQTLRKVGEMILTKAPEPETAKLDWAAFLGRNDPVWTALPQKFDHGAFAGNGTLGVTIYQRDTNALRFAMGRNDVTARARDNTRLLMGGLCLTTKGKITGGELRTDLWNAEIRGTVNTTVGAVTFTALVHAKQNVVVIDCSGSGGEAGCAWSWMPEKAVTGNARYDSFENLTNPPCVFGQADGVSWCEQKRTAGGSYTAAWTEKGSRLFFTIADTFPQDESKTAAVETVKRAAAENAEDLLKSHRDWWHAYYPASFVSVPDAQVEGFYWIQMYKLASAMRPDGAVMDLQGPWNRSTGWPRIWWNLNIQIAYSPVFAANRLELGESFTRFIDSHRQAFVANAKELWGFDDCATTPHTTSYDGTNGDGFAAKNWGRYINPGDFTWALWLYWQQYRYSMDESLVKDQSKHAFYSLLKGSVNLYLHLLQPGEDGKLHLPKMHSPEYGEAPDNNYNLSLLRWGCETLLALNERYHLNDSQIPEWKRVLKDLTPHPQDENGFMVGAGMPFARSHRHWSHMLMVWPLHTLSCEQPENKEAVEKTLRHWLTVEDGKQVYGWSAAAAAHLYATLGDGENALKQLRSHHNNKRFVMPNTQYIEGSPVYECSLVAASSLQYMLLQSWGGTIRIFPAMPKEWSSAAYQNLRAEGAFLVSAIRKDCRTNWVRIESLAGEPCKVKPNFTGAFVCDRPELLQDLGNGVYELALNKGESAVLYQGEREQVVQPCDLGAQKPNAWGLKESDVQPPPKS